MLKANNKHVLLLLIFAFSFIYRIVTMLGQTFPSGADIGLHSSVIYSITQPGYTNFVWNDYQMGGGLSLTFPGYHIFASAIIMMTGMPNYIAQAVIVSLFSALIVLCAYLVTRTAWTETGALIVAFLVAVSRFDMETLLWGGYPNVITLMLIPLTFYLFLQRDRFSLVPFTVVSSILVGSIFLTHSLSAVIFVAITFATVLIVFLFPKLFDSSRKHVLSWLLPVFFGVILVSPFLMNAIPAYLSANSTFADVSDIGKALMSTKVLPLELVLPLFGCFALFFILSKGYKDRYLTLPAFLTAMWLLVPLLLTQGYIVGLYTDFNRFLYFLLLPGMMLLGIFMDHGSAYFAYLIDNYRTLSSQVQKNKTAANKYAAQIAKKITRKRIYSGFVVGFLLVAFFCFPILVTPWQGASVDKFYQVMNNAGYEGIQWAKQNTPAGSVFVADALYGWWLGGFSQRPTLSAVDPQYLTVARELNPAKNASYLLDTDYLIDNGYVQVREDGGYIARHNPEILTKLNWTYFPMSFFNFNSNGIKIDYTVNGKEGLYMYADQLPVKAMSLENDSQSYTIKVVKGNDLFNYTQLTTVYAGTPMVNLTTIVDTTVAGVSLDFIAYNVQSKGTIIQLNNNTVGLLDEGVKAFGQLIFEGNADVTPIPQQQDFAVLNIIYNLHSTTKGQVQMFSTTYSVTDDPQVYKDETSIQQYFTGIIETNVKLGIQLAGNSASMITFDYIKAMQQNNVSYIANRDFGLNPKFAYDPAFNLVFINAEVAIFKVKANANPAG
jgi:hypothetical protein